MMTKPAPKKNAATMPKAMKAPAGVYKDAKMPVEAMRTDGYMTNNGESALSFGRMLTKGLDSAFPVK